MVQWDYLNEPRDIIQRLEVDAAELQKGIDQKDPSLVCHIAKDPEFCNFGRNWLCSSCPYENDCYRMRYQAGELDLIFKAKSIKSLEPAEKKQRD